MLSPHIKKNVDKLWNRFWTAGITNPLVAVEQITYLLFLKRLEAIDNERVKNGKKSIYAEKVKVGDQEIDGEQCRWRFIRQDKTPQHLINVVFPWLRELEKLFAQSTLPSNGIETIGTRMSDAYFQLDPNKGAILQEAIGLIDKLFERVDTISDGADIMGDTFEYLLSEIATAGKNGQFRTPRHIIRSMVEMVDPQLGEQIIDPAAGTGGFLFSSLDYLLKNRTSSELMRIEWDGTSHRIYGDQLTKEELEEIHKGKYFIGLDNDRTMVRIGWMNMILHGIDDPQIYQRDSLGKRKDEDALKSILLSEKYDVVLANPPFTGAVDAEDLEASIFPKAGTKGKKAKQVVTNKSELLFVWLMLDLLSVGGRCAVIVPEGVLFGNTEGHVRLRKELLTEHLVEAVVSLPAGVFQPYTGVKTSILVFQKETRKDERESWKPVDSPRTHSVWFYEIGEEAFSLDAKRTERRGQNNDLWDMLEKYKHRHDPETNNLDYYQPEYRTERWRMIDDHTMAAFSDEPEVPRWKNQAASISELFAGLPTDPEAAFEKISGEQQPILDQFALAALNSEARDTSKKAETLKKEKQRQELAEKAIKKAASTFRGLCDKQKGLFDQEERVAWSLYQKAYQRSISAAVDTYTAQIMSKTKIKTIPFPENEVAEKIKSIAREFAKLDGYDVVLRSLESLKTEGVLKEAKHWTAPVRVHVMDEEWVSEDGKLKGSHDENGEVRPEYVATLELYDEKGKLIDDLLDPDCIEARNWNLSAGQYKPFHFEAVKSDKSVAEMIREIQKQENRIMEGLNKLLAMVEG